MQLTDIFIFGVLLFVLIVWLFRQREDVDFVKSTIDNKEYLVQNLPDKQQAANTLAHINQKIICLINNLKKEYPDDIRVQLLNRNYNQSNVSEGLGKSGYTSYTYNKGQKIVICIRQTNLQQTIVDPNVTMYVVIHELAHLATEELQHTPQFWENFKFLLKNAIDLKAYKKQDFERIPQDYCGIKLSFKRQNNIVLQLKMEINNEYQPSVSSQSLVIQFNYYIDDQQYIEFVIDKNSKFQIFVDDQIQVVLQKFLNFLKEQNKPGIQINVPKYIDEFYGWYTSQVNKDFIETLKSKKIKNQQLKYIIDQKLNRKDVSCQTIDELIENDCYPIWAIHSLNFQFSGAYIPNPYDYPQQPIEYSGYSQRNPQMNKVYKTKNILNNIINVTTYQNVYNYWLRKHLNSLKNIQFYFIDLNKQEQVKYNNNQIAEIKNEQFDQQDQIKVYFEKAIFNVINTINSKKQRQFNLNSMYIKFSFFDNQILAVRYKNQGQNKQPLLKINKQFFYSNQNQVNKQNVKHILNYGGKGTSKIFTLFYYIAEFQFFIRLDFYNQSDYSIHFIKQTNVQFTIDTIIDKFQTINQIIRQINYLYKSDYLCTDQNFLQNQYTNTDFLSSNLKIYIQPYGSGIISNKLLLNNLQKFNQFSMLQQHQKNIFYINYIRVSKKSQSSLINQYLSFHKQSPQKKVITGLINKFKLKEQKAKQYYDIFRQFSRVSQYHQYDLIRIQNNPSNVQISVGKFSDIILLNELIQYLYAIIKKSKQGNFIPSHDTSNSQNIQELISNDNQENTLDNDFYEDQDDTDLDELLIDDDDQDDQYIDDQYTIKRMKQRDPELFRFKVQQKKNRSYSRLCQSTKYDRRQPIVLNDDEKQKIDKENREGYTNFITLGSSLEVQNHYICPQVWCPLSQIPYTKEQFEKRNFKCPRNEPAILNYNSQYWRNGQTQSYAQYLDPIKHPQKLCLPCCGKKQPNSLEQINKRDQCTQFDKIGSRLKLQGQKYPQKYQVAGQYNKLTCLPNCLDQIFDLEYFVRVGTIQTQGKKLLNSLVYCTDNCQNMSETLQLINKNLTLLDFIQINNGYNVQVFNNNNQTKSEVHNQEFLSFMKNQTQYLNKFDIVLEKLEQSELIREYRIYAAYQQFIYQLNNMDLDIHDVYLLIYPLFQMKLPWLNRQGRLIIIIDVSDEKNPIIQCNQNINIYDINDRKISFIYKNGQVYEPIVMKYNDTADQIYVSDFQQKNIGSQNYIINYIKQTYFLNCGQSANLTSYQFYKVIQINGINIDYQIIDQSFQVVGFLSNDVFILYPFNGGQIIQQLKIQYYYKILYSKPEIQQIEKIYNILHDIFEIEIFNLQNYEYHTDFLKIPDQFFVIPFNIKIIPEQFLYDIKLFTADDTLSIDLRYEYIQQKKYINQKIKLASNIIINDVISGTPFNQLVTILKDQLMFSEYNKKIDILNIVNKTEKNDINKISSEQNMTIIQYIVEYILNQQKQNFQYLQKNTQENKNNIIEIEQQGDIDVHKVIDEIYVEIKKNIESLGININDTDCDQIQQTSIHPFQKKMIRYRLQNCFIDLKIEDKYFQYLQVNLNQIFIENFFNLINFFFYYSDLNLLIQNNQIKNYFNNISSINFEMFSDFLSEFDIQLINIYKFDVSQQTYQYTMYYYKYKDFYFPVFDYQSYCFIKNN